MAQRVCRHGSSKKSSKSALALLLVESELLIIAIPWTLPGSAPKKER